MENRETDTNEEREKGNYCLTFSVFCVVTIGLILEVIAGTKALPGLCELVPDTRDYCETSINDNNITVVSKEMSMFTAYGILLILGVIAHLVAFLLACSLIFLCAKICCMMCCGAIYPCFVIVGHKWFIVFGFGAFCNLVAGIFVPIFIPLNDLTTYVDAYRYSVISLVYDIVTLIGWIIYIKCRGAPDPRYFLGSSKMISDYEVNDQKFEMEITYKYANGQTDTVIRTRNEYSLDRRY